MVVAACGGGGGSDGDAKSADAKSGSKAPIVIGLIGTYSGPAAPSIAPGRDGVLVWEKWVNSKGGINGHPVKVLVGDNALDDARCLSTLRDFVENRHVIAIVGMQCGGKPIAAYDYAKKNNIPIIGQETSDPEWQKNPLLFPQQPGQGAVSWSQARAIADTGAKTVGVLYCVEAPTCKQLNDEFSKASEENGVKVVYNGTYTIAQPDYTSECLQLKKSGAQAVAAWGEQNANIRLAQSCARQDYKPQWLVFGTGANRKVAEFEGGVSGSPVFPWFIRSGSPGIEEYVQAFKKFMPSQVTQDGGSIPVGGWISAKIFEKAAQHVSDTPTTADILKGLYAMKGETVDGLLPDKFARTYTKGQPTPDVFCTFLQEIKNGQWTAPKGLKPLCRDDAE
jgi:branched-chain amino acid transport system substrate-binding protein